MKNINYYFIPIYILLIIIIYLIGNFTNSSLINQDGIKKNQILIYDQQFLINHKQCEQIMRNSLTRFELPNSKWYVDRLCFNVKNGIDAYNCKRARSYINSGYNVSIFIFNPEMEDGIELT